MLIIITKNIYKTVDYLNFFQTALLNKAFMSHVKHIKRAYALRCLSVQNLNDLFK